ncbi:MAG: hypothetical protein KDH96_05750 [Candidatus Riesia sp.]|nr:hypothetical protein [Candidatus Riesia sp.]
MITVINYGIPQQLDPETLEGEELEALLLSKGEIDRGDLKITGALSVLNAEAKKRQDEFWEAFSVRPIKFHLVGEQVWAELRKGKLVWLKDLTEEELKKHMDYSLFAYDEGEGPNGTRFLSPRRKELVKKISLPWKE